MQYADFNTVKNIKLDEHNVSVLLGMPMDMLIMNDLAIILDHQTDRFFHVFSIDSLNHLGSFIRKGRGPGEEVAIDPYFKIRTSDEIYYQSQNDIKVARITTSKDTLRMVIQDKYELPASRCNSLDFNLVNNIFHSNPTNPRSKDYVILNTETGNHYEWGGPILLSDNRKFQSRKAEINTKLTTVNPERNLIASVYDLLPILRIYSLTEEKLITEQQMSDASDNLNLILTDQTMKLTNYYHRIKSTNEYIYALYGGYPINDFFTEGRLLLVLIGQEKYISGNGMELR